jgi:hypothetical protein
VVQFVQWAKCLNGLAGYEKLFSTFDILNEKSKKDSIVDLDILPSEVRTDFEDEISVLFRQEKVSVESLEYDWTINTMKNRHINDVTNLGGRNQT